LEQAGWGRHTQVREKNSGQWQERLAEFLEIPEGGLGVIGGGKKNPSSKIDIAVMQDLSEDETKAS